MPRKDSAWFDAQYNNRALVPNHAEIMARWAKASALTREQSSRRLDVRYGNGPLETLDIFPTPKADAPVLVFVHGGYWRSLDKSDFSFVAPAFVAAGAMVVVTNYALCPDVGMETIALQTARALAWMYRNAWVYGGDAQRIAVVGHSAGGHLATMMLSCDGRLIDRRLPNRLTRAALSISGLYDLAPLRKTSFLQADLQLTPASVKRLSPTGFAVPRGATLMTVAGAAESDEFRRQNRLMQQHWGAKTVPVCEEVAGANHFDVVHGLADPDGRLHALALQLLGLSPSSSTASAAPGASGASGA